MVSSRNGGEKQRRRLREIYRKAAPRSAVVSIPQVAFEAKLLLEGLEQLHTMIQETDTRIAGGMQQVPGVPLSLKHPRLRTDISAKVLGAIGNPHRFDNHRQVLKTAGLDLPPTEAGRDRMSHRSSPRKGKADLRYGLYQAALIASTRNHHFMTYFTNKLKGREREKGIGTKMRVKLAAKMLVIAWTLMKKKEMFDPGCLIELKD